MSKNSRKDLFKNIIKGDLFKKSSFLIISSTFGALSRFLLVTILARYLTPDSYGIWASITSVAAIMMFGDFGITNALRNKLSLLIAQKDETDDLQREYFFTSFYFFLAFAIALSLAFILISSYLPVEKLYNTQNALLRQQGVEIFIYIQVTFLLGIPFSMATGLFFSYDESKYVAIFNMINSVLSLASVLLLSFIFHVNIIILAKTYFSLNLFISFISLCFFIQRRNWQKKLSVSIKELPKRIKELLKTGIMFLGVQLSTSYINNLPTIFIGAVVDLKTAASFNIAQKLYIMVVTIYQSIFNPIWSKLTILASKQSWVEFKNLHRKIIAITFCFLFLFTLAMTGMAEFIFRIVVGNQYEASLPIVFVLGISTIFYAMFEATSLFQNALGFLKLRLFSQLFVILIINFIFKYIYDFWGILSLPVALASIWFVLFLILYLEAKKFIHNKL